MTIKWQKDIHRLSLCLTAGFFKIQFFFFFTFVLATVTRRITLFTLKLNYENMLYLITGDKWWWNEKWQKPFIWYKKQKDKIMDKQYFNDLYTFLRLYVKNEKKKNWITFSSDKLFYWRDTFLEIIITSVDI